MDNKVIEDHKNMVLMTGNLSDFHLNNLKNWPFIMFDSSELDSVQISYDFKQSNADIPEINLGAGVINYDFTFSQDPSLTNEEISLRLDTLSKWVKSIFWTNTEVNFKRDGKKWPKRKK